MRAIYLSMVVLSGTYLSYANVLSFIKEIANSQQQLPTK